MRATPRRDTSAEMALRAVLHAMGLRYRVDVQPLQGLRRRADVVLRRSKIAIFVDGCFWHGCPKHCVWPKSNADWWRAKIERNVERDRDTDKRLRAEGWLVLRVWEHERPESAATRLLTRMAARRRNRLPSLRPEAPLRAKRKMS